MMRGLALVLALALAISPAFGQRPEMEELLREAKLALLDRDWELARERCEDLLSKFPASSLAPQARFYLARAQEGAGRERQALAAYQSFLRQHPGPGQLQQDARTAAIGLARKLYDRGQLEHWRLLADGLEDPSPTVRSFAALQVSYLSDRRRARQAVPVLVEMIGEARDPDLRDRAKIALLRLDPQALASAGDTAGSAERPPPRRFETRGRWLKLRIYRGKSRRPEVSLNVPLGLAELVYRALSEDLKRSLREEKGIDLDNFWVEMPKHGPERILSIDSEGERIELWIE